MYARIAPNGTTELFNDAQARHLVARFRTPARMAAQPMHVVIAGERHYLQWLEPSGRDQQRHDDIASELAALMTIHHKGRP